MILQEDRDIEVIAREGDLVFVDKPAGVAVHYGDFSRGEQSSERPLLQIVRDQLGMRVYPIHRLDRATSGVCAFTTERSMLPFYMRQFELRTVKKTYQAVLRGWLAESKSVDKCWPRGDDGKPEVTVFAPLAHYEAPFGIKDFAHARYTLVSCQPLTGRYHQIRRHAKSLSHPIVGDTAHGDGIHNRLWRSRGVHRLLLHASVLELTGANGQRVAVESKARPLEDAIVQVNLMLQELLNRE